MLYSQLSSLTSIIMVEGVTGCFTEYPTTLKAADNNRSFQKPPVAWGCDPQNPFRLSSLRLGLRSLGGEGGGQHVLAEVAALAL